jgi:hypothetical protein
MLLITKLLKILHRHCFRATFARHPSASQIRIPDWLDEGRIDAF